MSFYKQYVEELLHNKHVLETDSGFATYSFLEPKTVYIENIYTSPKHRRSGATAQLVNSIIEIAKEKGCNKLLGSVTPSAKGSTTSLKVLLGYGLCLKCSTNDLIFFEKDIV